MQYKKTPLYVQSPNDCSRFTIFYIWRMKYGLKLNKKQRDKFLEDAKEAGVGVSFVLVYNFATGWAKQNMGIDMTCNTYDILTDKFDRIIDNGDVIGLGFKYASKFYRESRTDQIITMEEVNSFKKEDNTWAGHNHAYSKGYIVESLSSIKDENKLIKMDISVLKQAVKVGLYYGTVRTFDIVDKWLCYFLKQLHYGGNIVNVEGLDGEQKRAFDRAIELRDLFNGE